MSLPTSLILGGSADPLKSFLRLGNFTSQIYQTQIFKRYKSYINQSSSRTLPGVQKIPVLSLCSKKMLSLRKSPHMFVEPQKEPFLHFIKYLLKSQLCLEAMQISLTVQVRNIKKKDDFIYCSLPPKYLLPLRFLYVSISFLFIIKDFLKEFRYCVSGP